MYIKVLCNHNVYLSLNNENIINDEEISKIMAENDNNLLPNYSINDSEGMDELLQTEVLICENCMHPNIIGKEKFNRRTKGVKHMKIDNVVNAAFTNFCMLNKLDSNAGIAVLLKIMKDNPSTSKRIFSDIPKRKGKTNRSKILLNN